MSVIVLDRDGVINFDSPDYIKNVGEWQAIPGSIEAICLLSKAGFKIYVATNQAGLAKNKFTLDDLEAMHNKLRCLVKLSGGHIEKIFYCPHHPDDNCDCRKPGTGLLLSIEKDCGEDLVNQPFVGDSLKDIQAALSMGCLPILVRTGNGRSTSKQVDGSIRIYDDLLSFAHETLKCQ